MNKLKMKADLMKDLIDSIDLGFKGKKKNEESESVEEILDEFSDKKKKDEEEIEE